MNAVELEGELKRGASQAVSPQMASLWLKLFDKPWRSLALVAATNQMDLSCVTTGFDEVGRMTRPDERLRVMDMRGATLEALSALRVEISKTQERGERLLIVVDPPARSPLAVGVSRTADATCVAVRLGRSTVDEVKTAAAACDSAKLLGSIAIED